MDVENERKINEIFIRTENYSTLLLVIPNNSHRHIENVMLEAEKDE